ncbi:DUF7681 family protein [Pseudohongiella nitratireducens]|uniref:Acb2/Tad1 domain-containing protein n=1 Tax=Pseudohongiella nitratireducens TaxID=1768907 RepID=UPI0030EF171B
MENQHRKIKGYRELTQEEIDLMNEIKSKGAELEQLLLKCRAVDVAEGKTGDHVHDDMLNDATRWRAITNTHFQQGLMALTRSVAKPDFY